MSPKYTAMKKLIYKLAGHILALVIIFSALDISIAQKEKSIQGNTIIELNGFSVVSPSGDDWKYFITPDKNTVQFMFEYSNIQTEKRIQHLQLYSKIPC